MRYGQGLFNLQELTFSGTSRLFGPVAIATSTRNMQPVAKRGVARAGGADLDRCRAVLALPGGSETINHQRIGGGWHLCNAVTLAANGVWKIQLSIG